MKELVIVLFRKKWYAITFFVFLVTGSMSLAYLLQPQYEAAAKLLVTTGREKKPFLPNEKNSRSSYLQVSMEDVGSEVELLLSNPVLSLVVDRNNLIKTAVPTREDAIDNLRSKVNIEFVKRTNIISIKYRSVSPELARNIVNSLVDAYLAHHIKVFGHSYALNAVRKGLDESYKKLTDMEEKLNTFTAKKSISNIESQREMILDRLTEVENKYKILSSIKHKHMITELGAAEIGNISGDPAFLELSSRLTGAELKRIEILSKYGKKDRKVAAVDLEIKELKKLIKKMLKNNLSTWEELASYYRKRLNYLDKAKTKIDPMKREIENLTQEYLLNKEKYNEIKISTNLDNAGLSSVKVVSYASLSTTPVFPKKNIIFLVSIFFGTLGGITCAFGMNRFSGRLISTYHIQSLTDIPVLSSIPLYSQSELKSPVTLNNNIDNDLIRVGKLFSSFVIDSATTVLILSPTQNAGVNFVSRNLTRLTSENLQIPSICVTFKYSDGIPGSIKGLDEALASMKSISEKNIPYIGQKSDHLIIEILPEDKVLCEKKIKDLLNLLKKSYQYIFLDMPSQREGMFYINFIQNVDFLFIVVAYDVISKHHLLQMVDIINKHNGKVSGCIFNKRKNPVPSFIYDRFF